MVTTPEPQLDEYGFNYYPVLVKVQCGLTSGWLCGGHYNRLKVTDSDVRVICCCDLCTRDLVTGDTGVRMTCRDFEKHTGKESAKKCFTSIKTVELDGTQSTLKQWIAKECRKLGQALVGHGVAVWWPGEQRYYQGFVSSFDQETFVHQVHYPEDADVEDLWLAIESFRDLGPIPDWQAQLALLQRSESSPETLPDTRKTARPRVLHNAIRQRLRSASMSKAETPSQMLQPRPSTTRLASQSKALSSSGQTVQETEAMPAAPTPEEPAASQQTFAEPAAPEQTFAEPPALQQTFAQAASPEQPLAAHALPEQTPAVPASPEQSLVEPASEHIPANSASPDQTLAEPASLEQPPAEPLPLVHAMSEQATSQHSTEYPATEPGASEHMPSEHEPTVVAEQGAVTHGEVQSEPQNEHQSRDQVPQQVSKQAATSSPSRGHHNPAGLQELRDVFCSGDMAALTSQQMFERLQKLATKLVKQDPRLLPKLLAKYANLQLQEKQIESLYSVCSDMLETMVNSNNYSLVGVSIFTHFCL